MAAPYKVTVSPEALVEIVQIATWWRANRTRAPRLFQTELDDVLSLIADNPELGVRARSTRVVIARIVELLRSGYRVYYQVIPTARELLVVHVRHGRRRPLPTRRR